MNQEKIWEYFQNEAISSFDQSYPRLRYLVQEASRLCSPPAKICNIGVGGGILENIADNYGFEVYSVDPDSRAIERLRERLGLGEHARVGYIQSLPFESDFFDCVVASEVLEHLSYEVMIQGLQEIRRTLKPGGYFIGTVPARENLQANLTCCPKCGEIFHRWGHMQSFDKNRMHEILSSYFVVKKIIQRPFVNFHLRDWQGKVRGIVRYAIWKLGWHWGYENLVFVARKEL